MSRHDRFIERAAGVALTSECRQRHGAIIVKGSKILAASVNKKRNSPEVHDHSLSYHAEDAVLRELCWKTGQTYGHGVFTGMVLYVARVSTSGATMLSRPCRNCWETITWQGITTVVYTNDLTGHSVETVG